MGPKHTTIIFQIALTFVVLSSFGCDAIYRMLDKEGAEEKELVGDIIPFEQNPTIQEVQSLLRAYGYRVGSIDGVLGLHTRNAIEKFQKDNNLKTTRFVDKETWAMLNMPLRQELLIDYEIDIRRVQEILKAAGFDPGVVDGKLGPKTKKAVMAFQQAHGLKVDGKIGFQTLSKLAENAFP